MRLRSSFPPQGVTPPLTPFVFVPPFLKLDRTSRKTARSSKVPGSRMTISHPSIRFLPNKHVLMYGILNRISQHPINPNPSPRPPYLVPPQKLPRSPSIQLRNFFRFSPKPGTTGLFFVVCAMTTILLLPPPPSPNSERLIFLSFSFFARPQTSPFSAPLEYLVSLNLRFSPSPTL